MNIPNTRQRGFSLIELMIAIGLGIFLLGAVLSVYLAQSRSSKTTVAQAAIQNAENAITALVGPTLRGTGFGGCSSSVFSSAALVAGGSAPLGLLSNPPATVPMVAGYDAFGTDTTSGSAYMISADNPANDALVADWVPPLDSTLAGSSQKGSDVLVVFGGSVGVSPIGVLSAPKSSNTFSLLSTTTEVKPGIWGAITNCGTAHIFRITAVTPGSGTVFPTISHDAGSSALDNQLNTLPITYYNGAQFIPLQQTAFYVAKGTGDQSVLMRATYSSSATWVEQPLVPGVESMQVLYGVGSGGVVTQYFSANNVLDFGKITSLRLGFLIQGLKGSGTTNSAGLRAFNVIGTTVTVPNDGRLRHVFEMTVNLRNAN